MFRKVISVITTLLLLSVCVIGLVILQTQKDIIETQNDILQPRITGIAQEKDVITMQPVYATLEEEEEVSGIITGDGAEKTAVMFSLGKDPVLLKNRGDIVEEGEAIAEGEHILLSPARGIITGISSEEGVVRAEVIDYDNLFIKCSIPPESAVSLSAGDNVEIIYGSSTRFSGEIRYISYVANASGSIDCEISFIDTKCVTRLNTAATVRLVTRRLENTMALPLDCVLKTSEGYAVQVMEYGVPSLRGVEIGIVTKDYVQILSGISPVDNVVYGPDRKYGEPLKYGDET